MKDNRLNGFDAVAETMLIPLCYRAVEARQPEPLVRDECAQKIIDRLGIDPAHLKWRQPQQVFAMLRARQFDRWAQDFISRKPRAVVVEIGCGLDARFERLDNGQVEWFDMDLPAVIDLRRGFFPTHPRRAMLAHSVFDLSWLDCIPPAGPHLFLAEGVFAYFEESEVRRVITTLAERFPGSEMVVDALSAFMVRSSALVPWFRGYQTRPRWAFTDGRQIETWSSCLHLLETYGYFDTPEPRLAGQGWMKRIKIFRESAHVLRLKFGSS